MTIFSERARIPKILLKPHLRADQTGFVPRRSVLREFHPIVLPTVGAYLSVNTVSFNLGFVIHVLLCRTCRVLNFEADLVAGTFFGNGLTTERTGWHEYVML